MRSLSLIIGLGAALGLATPLTAAAQTTAAAPPADIASAPTSPHEATLRTVAPDGLISTSTVTHLDDGLSGTLISTTITNKPIPDSPESRLANGGPDSAAGRATLPQPGPAVTARSPAKPSTPKPPTASQALQPSDQPKP